LRTEMQASSMAISNVIPSKRSTHPIKKNAVHGTEQSDKTGELDLARMETTVGALIEHAESHSVVRQDKVERMRQRLLIGLYTVDAEQIAGSILKRQLMKQLITSRKLRCHQAS
jgi:anti-sigma28 factor (negative regulator of flagellin synthesis)